MQSFKHGFSQFISYLFHPGIMPTVGALFVLWSVPETYSWNTIFKITSTIFVGIRVTADRNCFISCDKNNLQRTPHRT